MLDVLVQTSRVRCAALRLMRKLLIRQGGSPRVLITEKLRSYPAAKREIMPGGEHRSHTGLNNRAENSHQPTGRRERIMKRFKSPRHLQRFIAIHDPIANLFHLPRHKMTSEDFRERRATGMDAWRYIVNFGAAWVTLTAPIWPRSVKFTVPLQSPSRRRSADRKAEPVPVFDPRGIAEPICSAFARP